MATFIILFGLRGDAFTDFFTKTIPSAARSVGNAFKDAGEAVYKTVLKPTYEHILEPAYQKVVKPTYEVVLKPVGETVYQGALKPVGNFFKDQVYESGLKIAGNAIFDKVLEPTGTFFKETVYEKGLKEGFYETGLRDTIYEKGLKKVAIIGDKDLYVKTIYEGLLRDTIYEKGLRDTIYEKGLKGAVYEKFLRDMVYKVGLNWVGEEILIPTLVKVIMPAIKYTMIAIDKVTEWSKVAYDKAIAPWIAPIYNKMLLPVLGPTWEKALGPLLKWSNEKVLKPTGELISKALNPLLDPLLEPLRMLQRQLDSLGTSLDATKEYIEGTPLYKTDAQGNFVLDEKGEKTIEVDEDGVPVIDPNNPSLPDRLVNVVGPVYSIVNKFSGTTDADPTEKASSFVDVVGNVVVTIYETRKQIKDLQTQLTQNINGMTSDETKLFQDALTELDTDLKALADAVSLTEEQKQGYQLVRPADPTKKLESVFCPEQGGVMCKIVYQGIASKLVFDANLLNLNKALEKLGNDLNAGSNSCVVCAAAEIADKDCTFTLRLQLAGALLIQIANEVIRQLIEKLLHLDLEAIGEIVVKDVIMEALPSSIASSLRNMAHGVGK